jgi:hypothetical protein
MHSQGRNAVTKPPNNEKYQKTLIAPFKTLLYDVVCEGDTEWNEYVSNLMAFAAQKPDELTDRVQLEILQRVKARPAIYEFLADFFNGLTTPIAPEQVALAAATALERSVAQGGSDVQSHAWLVFVRAQDGGR